MAGGSLSRPGAPADNAPVPPRAEPQPAQSGRERRLRPSLGLGLALVPAIAIVFVAFVIPIARLIFDSLAMDGQLSGENYAHLVTTPTFGRVVWRTLYTSILVTLVSAAIGYPLAYTLWRLPGRFAAPLLIVVTIPYFTSILIRSYAWVVILGTEGLVNTLLTQLGLAAEPLRLVHNEIGLYVGMVQIQLPVFVLPAYAVMRQIDPATLRAARSLGASPASTFWHVFRPLSMPGAAAGVSLVFVTSLGFYVTPLLLGGAGDYLIAQSIDARVSRLQDFGAGAAQATVLLLAVLTLMYLLRRSLGLATVAATMERPLAQPVASGGWRLLPRRRGPQLRSWRRLVRIRASTARVLEAIANAARWPVLALVSASALVYLAAPLVVVFFLAFSDAPYLTFPPPGYSLRWFAAYLSDTQWINSTVFSLAVGVSSAAIATVVGTMAAFPLVRSRLVGSDIARLLFMAPLIVPTMIVAVGAFFVLIPFRLIGNPMAFVLVYAALGIPYAVVVMTAMLQSFDRSLEQAASSLGAGPLRVARSITLRLLRPGMAAAFLFAFLVGFDDVVIAMYLGGPDSVTLPIRMWQDIRLEISPKIAAVGVLFFSVTIAAMAASSFGLRRARGGAK